MKRNKKAYNFLYFCEQQKNRHHIIKSINQRDL